MPHPGMLWRHVIINTHSTWHHGDERGFRSRKHRIHSSGDYKNPPPKGEHAGLLEYRFDRSSEPVEIKRELRPVVGRSIVDHFASLNHRVLSVAVGKIHAHAVVELPWARDVVKVIVGHAKRKSSRAVKDQLPGTLWAAGGTYKPVRDREHLKSAYEYVLYDQGPGAWTWSYKDGSREGRFGRRRPARRAKKPGRR